MNQPKRKIRGLDNLFGGACLLMTILFFNIGLQYIWAMPSILLWVMFLSMSEWVNVERLQHVYMTVSAWVAWGYSVLLGLLGIAMAVVGTVVLVSNTPSVRSLMQSLWPLYAGYSGAAYLALCVCVGFVFILLSLWAIDIIRFMYPLDFDYDSGQISKDVALTRNYRKGIDRDPR
jgi:hypothetical protein